MRELSCRRSFAVAACAGLTACSLVVSVDGLAGPAAATTTTTTTDDAGPTDDVEASALDSRNDEAAGADLCSHAGTPDPSLVAYFPFDEGSGITATDCSSSGLSAVSVGGAALAWTAGRVGQALDLRKGSSCLSLGLARVLTSSRALA